MIQYIRRWVGEHRRPALFGAISGVLWGFMTAAGATPRAWLVYDIGQDIVVVRRAEIPQPITIPAAVFFQTYTTNLIQVTLTFLVLCCGAGWVAWQLSRIRPRGQRQPALRTGWDTFVILFLLGGLLTVALFQRWNLGEWFKGPQPTATVIGTAVIGVLLPLIDGVGLFFIWFLRLNSVRAPDWETHYPRPRDWLRPLLGRAWRTVRPKGKGGKKIERETIQH
jgi:hypothetical protein